MNKLEWVIADQTTLNAFLDQVPGISGRKRRDIFKTRRIQVNGSYRPRSASLAAGDVVSIALLDEVFDESPLDMQLSVLYEDDYVMAVHKPPYLTMAKGQTTDAKTLSAGVANMFYARGIVQKVRFINRLDRDTSGIVLIASSDLAHSAFAKYWSQADKKYLAIASGTVAEDFVADDHLVYQEDALRYVVEPEGVRAVTAFRVCEKFPEAMLLEATLLTGKTHQIRASLAYRKTPLLGDRLYGGTGAPRQMLHASTLRLYHPFRRKWITIEAPLPEDFVKILDTLRL